VVLEKDVEDQLERRIITQSQRGEEYRKYSTREEGLLDWSHLALELPCIEGKIEERIQMNRKTRKKM
jgi:hypothetical protein